MLLDADSDGVVDQLDSVDYDPYNDQDGDGFPNQDDFAGTNPLDLYPPTLIIQLEPLLIL